MAGLTLASPSAEPRRAYSPWREAWRRYRRHRLAVVSAGVLLLLIVAVVFGPWLWRIPINDIDSRRTSKVPRSPIRSAPTTSGRISSPA